MEKDYDVHAVSPGVPNAIAVQPGFSNFPELRDNRAALKAALPKLDRSLKARAGGYALDIQRSLIEATATQRTMALAEFSDRAGHINANLRNSLTVTPAQGKFIDTARQSMVQTTDVMHGYASLTVAMVNQMSMGDHYLDFGMATLTLDREQVTSTYVLQVELGTGIEVLPLYPYALDITNPIVVLPRAAAFRIKGAVRDGNTVVVRAQYFPLEDAALPLVHPSAIQNPAHQPCVYQSTYLARLPG